MSRLSAEIGLELSGVKAKISTNDVEFGSVKLLEKTIKELERSSEIGTVLEPRSWFSGQLVMKRAILTEERHSDLVFFSGVQENVLVCLVGSAESIVGWPKSDAANH